MKVVIVGAGVAGLAAGSALREKGVEVVLLEAQNRIGGRVWTDRSFANFPIENGAEFIHGNKVSTWRYLKRNDKTVACGGIDQFTYFIGGRWVTGKKLRRLHGYRNVFKTGDWLPKVKNLRVDKNILEWVGKLPLGIGAKEVAARVISAPYLAQPEELSLKELVNEWRSDNPGRGNFRLRHGYDTVVRTLSRGLKVLHSEPVRQVRWSKKKVLVTTPKRSLQADKVIVTAPLSILQKGVIRFVPSLPGEIEQAIQSLVMGQVAKIHMRFKKVFWDSRSNIHMGQGGIEAWWSPSYKRKGVVPVFTGWADGKVAEELSNLGAGAASDCALAKLENMFGSSVGKLFMRSRFVSWTNDPWTQGGYSFVPVGAYGARQVIARPMEDTLYFAGEAVAPVGSNPSTVHGAIDSGLKAAKMILSQISSK